jgi:hypothetical protein
MERKKLSQAVGLQTQPNKVTRQDITLNPNHHVADTFVVRSGVREDVFLTQPIRVEAKDWVPKSRFWGCQTQNAPFVDLTSQTETPTARHYSELRRRITHIPHVPELHVLDVISHDTQCVTTARDSSRYFQVGLNARKSSFCELLETNNALLISSC